MADLKLDPLTGDLLIVNGDLALTDDASGETVAQRIRIRLRLFRGEWFLDTRLGLPFFQEVFKKNPDLALIESLVKTAILETEGVVKLLSYSQSLDRATRELSVSFKVEAESGADVEINEVLG